MLHRKNSVAAQEWMGRLWTEEVECEYKEYDRLLTEQFISGLNDKGMNVEILKESATLADIKDAMSECVLVIYFTITQNTSAYINDKCFCTVKSSPC